MPIRRRRENNHKFGQILMTRLHNIYGNDVAVGCRNIAAVETDEDEKAFWLELADEWEKRHPPAENREVEKIAALHLLRG
jgi:hypothetical protein